LTITEVCCALAALALLMMVALPALGMSKGRSQRIVCVNNLSRIGLANAMWGADHDNRRPMMTPYWEGGIQTSGILGTPPPGTPVWPWGALNHQAWFHYFWLSNELVTPKVLVCPSDSIKRPAIDWSTSVNRGLSDQSFRGNAVSYIVAHNYSESDRGLVSGDRNFPYTAAVGGCAYGLVAIRVVEPGGGVSGWVPPGSAGLHGLEGNLLYKDGSVEQVDSARLASLFSPTNWSLGTVHYIVP
jgi:hypothetical protein